MQCEAEKKCTLLKNSTLMIIKLNTSSIQYILRCQWLLGLSRYSTEFYKTYSLLQLWECHSMVFWSMNSQNPSWYSSLISISILSSHIHTGLLNILFPTCFPIKNHFKLTFIPMQATFLTDFATIFRYPSIWQTVQIMKLHIIHHFPPISSVFILNIILVTLSSNKTTL